MSKKKPKTPAAAQPEVLATGLRAAKANLQKQVGTGPNNISQGAADGEFNRLRDGVKNGTISLTDDGKEAPAGYTSGSMNQSQIDSLINSFNELEKSTGEKGLANTLISGLIASQPISDAISNQKLAETNPDLQKLQGEAQGAYDKGYQTDPATQAAIDALTKQLGTAGQYSPDMIEALAKAKGLTTGYSQPQLNALQGNILRQVGTDTSSALNTLQGRLGANNLQGGVAAKLAAQLALGGVQKTGQLQSQLLADQFDKMLGATTAYGNLAGSYNSQANSNLSDVAGKLGTLSTTNQSLGQDYRLKTFQNLLNATSSNVGFTQNAQTANQNLNLKSIDTMATMPYTYANLYESVQGRKSAENIAEMQAKAAQGFSAGGGGGGGSSSGGGRTYSTSNSKRQL